VGFAYDGDADRCIAVDERGHVVDGDLILYVCGKYLAKHGRLAAEHGRSHGHEQLRLLQGL
jgi:phosphoglucosamine mutase